MAEDKKLVIEVPNWVHNIILTGCDDNKKAKWYCPADFFEINKYTDSAYQEGLKEGKKIGEQEGLDKAWAAARFSQEKILLKQVDILIVLMLI